MTPTFTESIRAQQLELLAKAKHLTSSGQRKSHLVSNCPFTDPIKVRAWKAMAKALTEAKVSVRRIGATPEEQDWLDRNNI